MPSTRKKAAKKRATKPAKARESHGRRFADHLASIPATMNAAPLDPEDPRVRLLLALAAGDPVVRTLVEALVRGNAYFALFDVETYAGVVLRGKGGEAWNQAHSVIGPRELAIAKNGAGDLYVWNADDGRVRVIVHDAGWTTGHTHQSIDAFLESVLWSALEHVEADELDEADDRLRASIALAVAIAGADALDDEAREKLVELGVL